MLSRFVAFTSIGRKALPNQYDLFAFALVFAAFIALTHVSHGLTVPLTAPKSTVVSLDYWLLPYYALRTTLRMFAAIAASLVFTFVYATLAAKSRRAALVLIPLLDVLQSVPIFGFLSFTVTFFLGLFPGSILGAECAAVFAIFTSQAWNMAFSFYQSLRSVPSDLDRSCARFPPLGLAEVLATRNAVRDARAHLEYDDVDVGRLVFRGRIGSDRGRRHDDQLPGIGSYLALAIEEKRIDAVFAAIVAMLAVIIAYDQLLFRPLVALGSRFRVELSAGRPGKVVRRAVFRADPLDAVLMSGPARLFTPFATADRNCRSFPSANLRQISPVALKAHRYRFVCRHWSHRHVWAARLYRLRSPRTQLGRFPGKPRLRRLHHDARHPAHGTRNFGLGAVGVWIGSSSGARRKGAAARAISSGVSGECCLSDRRHSLS